MDDLVVWRNNNFFWMAVLSLVGLKLYLVSGGAVQMIYAPHDDGLYVSRAFHLLTDGSLGPYDSRLLVKELGLSLWLAGARILGLPYLFLINIVYASAGLYFIWAMRRLISMDAALVVVFGLFLFNPVSIDWQWFRVMREPLSISLLVILLSSMLHILIHLTRGALRWTHFIVLAITFSFSLSLREEDILLSVLLLFFSLMVVILFLRQSCSHPVRRYFGLALMITLPVIFASLQSSMMSLYVEKNYGVRLVNDFSDGEFPKLVAAIRSIRTSKDNRHVMVSQEALAKLRVVVPDFSPVIDRLPPPGETSYSCHRFKVCSEWTNGWMLFWVKDAAYQAGLTNSLPDSQSYFRSIRLQIEDACGTGRLDCSRRSGSGLLPMFELRWTRAFVSEFFNVLPMLIAPRLAAVGQPPATYPVSVEYGQMYQAVTMSHHYDSLRQSQMGAAPWSENLSTYRALRYWLRYPDVAMNDHFGVLASAEELGAALHYNEHGQHEGRIWDEAKTEKSESSLFFALSGEGWKASLISGYDILGKVTLLFGLLCLLLRLFSPLSVYSNELLLITFLFIAFTGVRILAIAYVSIYMGSLDLRLFFSSYVVLILLSSLLIVDTLRLIINQGMSSQGSSS